jgi:hypothetical protein
MLPDTITQGAFASSNACLTALDCGNTNDFMCEREAEGTETCVCYGVGLDTCNRAGTCLTTPAKVCSDCLGDFTAFAAAHINETNAAELSEAFKATCLQTRPVEVCMPVAEAIMHTLNFGLRAGGICTMLPDCNLTTLPSTAVLVYPGILPGSIMYGRPQDMDLCTIEGLPGGMPLPGFTSAPAGGMVPGSCANTEDCTALYSSNYFCDRNLTSTMCSCANGTDMCVSVGSCHSIPQSPTYDPYKDDSLPQEFCSEEWQNGGVAGYPTGVARLSLLQGAPSPFADPAVAVANQETAIGTIAEFTMTKDISNWYYYSAVSIEGRVLTEQLAAGEPSAYNVGPFGWLTSNSTPSSYNKASAQPLPSYVASWFDSMNNANSTGYYQYNRYRNPVPKLAGLSQPASLHYGQLSMVVPVGGTIIYLAGRVVGTSPLSASTGLLAFEGWYTFFMAAICMCAFS